MELSSPWHLPTFPFLLKISQGTFIFFLYVHKNEVSLEFPFAHLLSLLLVIFYPTCSLVSSHLIQWSRNTTIRRSLYTITTSQLIPFGRQLCGEVFLVVLSPRELCGTKFFDKYNQQHPGNQQFSPADYFCLIREWNFPPGACISWFLLQEDICHLGARNFISFCTTQQ